MTVISIVSAIIALYFGVRAVRRAGVLPVWRVSMRSVPSLADEAEHARILAMPVEELADEIVREREAHVVRLPEAQASYAVAVATFLRSFGVEQRPYGGPGRCLLDACSGPMFSSPTTRRSICGRCGRVVDWEVEHS